MVGKRLLSGLLCAAMLAGSFNDTALQSGVFSAAELSAFAEDDTTYVQTFGYCGENLLWEYMGDGLLEIRGTGDMTDYGWDKEGTLADWKDLASVVKYVDIQEGVTSIGSDAFYMFKELKAVSMPSTLRSIGDAAFMYCGKLHTVDTDLTLPPEAQTNVIKLPEGLEKIDGSAFQSAFDMNDEVTVIIPNSVTSMGSDVFYDSDVASVTISKNLKAIPTGMFCSCRQIESLTIPKNVQSLGEVALYNMSALMELKVLNPNLSESDFPYINFKKRGFKVTCYEGSALHQYLKNVEFDETNLTLLPAPESTYDGTCGATEYDGVCWNLYDDGTLKFSGDDYMQDYPLAGLAPWHGLESEVDKIVIEDGVRSIGAATLGFFDIAELYLPASIETIGGEAFVDCKNLKNIIVDEDNPYICFENGIFYNKEKTEILAALPAYPLGELIIPDGVETIDSMAFYKCSKLTALALPDSLKEIGENAFRACENLTTADIPCNVGENAFYLCSKLEKVTIWEGCQEIGESAFRNCDLHSVKLPISVSHLSNLAFAYNPNLEYVSVVNPNCQLDDASLLINDTEFVGKIYGALNSTAMSYANAHEIPFVRYTPAVVEDGTFDTTEGTVSWSLDEYGLLTISGSGYMADTDEDTPPIKELISGEVKELLFEYDVYHVGAGVFAGLDALTTVTLPNSVVSVGENAFADCTGLTEVYVRAPECTIAECENTFPQNAVIYGYSGSGAESYADCYGRSFRSLNSLSNIVASGFCGGGSDASATEKTLYWRLDADGTLMIEGDGPMRDLTAFDEPCWPDRADEIKRVIIRSGVATIGNYAFRNCKNLSEVILPAHTLTSIGQGAFSGCEQLTTFRVPDSVETLNYDALGCGGRPMDIWILNPDCYINLSAFSDTARVFGYVGSTAETHAIACNQIFVDIEKSKHEFEIFQEGTCGESDDDFVRWTLNRSGVLTFTGGGKMGNMMPTETWKKYSRSVRKIVLEDGVENLSMDATLNTPSVQEIEFGSTVSSMPEGCTWLMKYLTRFTVSADNPTYCTDEYGVLYSADKKILYAYPTGLQNSTYTVPEGTEKIAAYAFERAKNLTNIILPSTLTEIGEQAFKTCDNLENVTLPEGLTAIGSAAFSDCTKLTETELPSMLETVGSSVFSGCKELTKAVINCPVSNSMFSGCEKLDTIVWGEGCSEIGEGAFYSCVSLTEVSLPESVTALHETAFGYCTNLETVSMAEGCETIGDQVFRGCSSLKTVLLPETLEKIGSYVFENCASLTAIALPSSLRLIGKEPFLSCVSLAEISVDANNTSFCAVDNVLFTANGKSLICYPNGLTAECYEIPEKTKSIGEYAFRDASVKEIIIPDTVITVGKRAFDGAALESLEIPENVITVGSDAFHNCYSLKELRVMNPDCEFSEDTYANTNDNLVVYGYAGSTAEAYAELCGYAFIELPPVTTTTTTETTATTTETTTTTTETTTTTTETTTTTTETTTTTTETTTTTQPTTTTTETT
ncbi:MAG: leucine-rich repeat domain-containing protein, partial [Oscillospiraceae bacterium]|nr:leucine-rich repeat domain-containing protein [Oscillospiraceae bacterium]